MTMTTTTDNDDDNDDNDNNDDNDDNNDDKVRRHHGDLFAALPLWRVPLKNSEV